MGETKNTGEAKKLELPRWLAVSLEIFGGLVLLVTGIYGFTAFIDGRIRSVVTDENYIRKIAAEVRPSVIFDSRGSILADMGAMRYLDSIQVLETNKLIAPALPAKIIVRPKRHLAQAP